MGLKPPAIVEGRVSDMGAEGLGRLKSHGGLPREGQPRARRVRFQVIKPGPLSFKVCTCRINSVSQKIVNIGFVSGLLEP